MSSKNTKISVIILTKNSQKHIRQCLDSVISQKNINFEVIIVDAGSVDNTIQIIYDTICLCYSSKTKIIRVDANTSIGKARQIGLKQSHGDVIAWIDSDVELPHENWLKNMSDPLENIEIAGTQTLSKNKSTDPWILKHLHSSFKYKNNIIDINKYEIIGTGHCLIKKKIIDDIGGVPDVWSLEDITMTRKIMERGYKFLYLSEEKVYHYHVDSFWHYVKKHWFRNKYNIIRRYILERKELNRYNS